MKESISDELHPIIAELHALQPRSRRELLDTVYGLLGTSIRDVIDTHNTESTMYIFDSDFHSYALKIEFGDNSATQKEAEWYDQLPAALQYKTPSVHATKKSGTYGFVLLDYIANAKTVDELAADTGNDALSVKQHLQYALDTDMELFEMTGPKKVPPVEIDSSFLYKYAVRMRQASQFPYLNQLLGETVIRVNDITLRTPGYYIDRIRADPALHTYLAPTVTSVIHGDLHGGNILACTIGTFLIDPKSTDRLPLEYDYGKLLHTVNGGYGLIMQNKYQFSEPEAGSYYFDVPLPEAYTDFHRGIRGRLTDRFLVRSYYAEALHFATMLPHHASKHEETTVLLIRCMQLFKELFDNLDINDHELRTSTRTC